MSCIFDNSQKQMQGCNNVENYYQMTINYSIIRLYYRDYVKNVYSTLIFCKCFLGLILNLGISGAQGHTVVIWAEKTPSKFLKSVLCRCIITWEWTQTPPLNQWKFQALKFKLSPGNWHNGRRNEGLQLWAQHYFWCLWEFILLVTSPRVKRKR